MGVIKILFPLTGLAAGIILTSLGLKTWWFLPFILGALIIYFILTFKASTPLLSLKLAKWHYAWSFLLFIGIGILNTSFRLPPSLDSITLSKITHIKGRVDDIKILAAGDKLDIDVIEAVMSDNKRLILPNFKISVLTDGIMIDYDDIISFPVNLTLDNSRNNNFGFYENKSYFSRIKGEEIKRYSTSKGILYYSKDLRERIAIQIEKSSLDRETAEFVISLLLGDRSLLSQERKKSFEHSGISHILAVSGMHVGILTAICLLIFFPLRFVGNNKTPYYLTLLVIWGFAFLTGMSLSTVRACIMTSFLLIAMIMERRRNAGNALVWALFLILLFDPFALFNAGLQLSVLCVASLIIFSRPLNKIDLSSHPVLHKTMSLVLISLITTGATWALVSYYFKNIPLLFIPANLLIVPCLPLFMGLSILYVVLLLLGFDWNILAKSLDGMFGGFDHICRFLFSFNHSTIHLQVDWLIPFLWVLALALLAIGFKFTKNRLFIFSGVALLFISLILTPFFNLANEPKLIVHKDRFQIKASMIVNDEYYEKTLPRNTVSQIKLGNHHFLSIDRAVDNMELIMEKLNRYSSKEKLLIIAAGCNENEILSRKGIEKFDKILIHPSISKKREKNIFETARLRNLPLYSLREEGALELILQNDEEKSGV